MKTLLLYSGGLDSTVLLYELLNDEGDDVECVSFYYGQKHDKELSCATKICRKLRVKHQIVHIPLLGGSSLTGGKGSVVVPNRNAVMLHIAGAMACARGMDRVAYSATKDDRDQFPDCRVKFVESIQASWNAAELGVDLFAPHLDHFKYQLVLSARLHDCPIEETWSCYAGGEEPCGKCGACNLREAAINTAHNMAD